MGSKLGRLEGSFMRVFNDLDSVKEALVRPVVSVGNFDGVHLGHQAILREVVRLSEEMNRPAVAFTFEPHPQKFLMGHKAPPLLTTFSQKMRLLENLGIATAIICPFDENLYRYSAEQFFSEILVRKVGVAHLVEGEDFTFGRGRSGSPELLEKLGMKYGVGVTIMGPVIFEGKPVSSTGIRALIQEGNVTKARTLLGRPYTVEGEKVRGKGRGRTLGYPTVNLSVENELLPPIGIYAVQVQFGQRTFSGAASLGFNPTFEGDHFSFEVHLLDFGEDIVDEPMSVLFYEKLRDEVKFDSDQELIRQMEADVSQVKRFFREGRP